MHGLATALLLSAFLTGQPPVSGPALDVVIGPKAPPLEHYAAQELAFQWKGFNSTVRIWEKVPENAANLILLGSPTTNPAIRAAVGNQWPKLTDQGLILRSVTSKGRQTLVVGGGSPVATLWAVYELGHRFGIRYTLHDDHYPVETPTFKFDGFDVVMEPNLRVRTWRTINDFAIGPESWGLEEHRRVLKQLAKLKFNRVMVTVYPWQPFAHYEYKGVKKSTAMLWYGYRYPVDGDTPGRAAFKGIKEFENPDLAGKTTYEEKTAAGIALVRGILDTARELGMSTSLGISPLEFTKEFAAVLPKAKVLYSLESLVIGPGPLQPPDDPNLMGLVAAQIRGYLTAYPQVDALSFYLPEFPDWVEHADKAWQRLAARAGNLDISLRDLEKTAADRKLIASGQRGVQALRGNITALEFFHGLLADPGLFKRTDGRKIETVLIQVDTALYPILDKVMPPGVKALHFVDYTARRVAEHVDLLAKVPTQKVPSSLIFTLADDNVGVLPQMTTTYLHTLTEQLRRSGWEGFSTRYWIIGDLDPSVYYLSRASFDDKVTPKSANEELISAVCGDGVAERMLKAFDMIEKATTLIDQNDIGFTFPVPGVVMKHYAAKSAPPAWWKQVKDLYAGAMDEVYRANTRARGGGRAWTFYFAKRLEFAYEYLSCVENVRLAGEAKAKGHAAKQLEHLEKAVEAMFNSLEALAAVARDSCDRGVIAALNEHGYRPLKKEFEAVEKVGKEASR